MRTRDRLILSFLLLTLAVRAEDAPAPVGNEHVASKRYVPPKDPALQQKLAWWQGLKFGLLMHWGTYSQWGIVESWSICPEDEAWCRRTGPFAGDYFAYRQAYEKLQTTFNPTQFNPEHWAAAAKEAGMRYVVFTTKHHDGFCMFDTAQTDYRITATNCPFHANPRANVTKEVFAAFRKEGFGIGAYFSKPDWHCPDYWWPYFPPRDRNPNYDLKRYPQRWRQYKDFTWKQIEELMTGYGSIDILWLDGGWVCPPHQDIDMNALATMARQHQPGLLVVDRSVAGENENYCTPENEVPGQLLPYPWETCMTMGNSWSYVPNDHYKSTGTLVRHLCRIVARGGNLLLNVGPNAQGEFDLTAYARLKEISQWMAVNSEAIYETRPVKPYERGDYAFTGKPDGTIYALLLAKNDQGALPETISLPAELTTKLARLTLLGHGELQVGETQDGQTTVAIPAAVRAHPPCAHAWVFKLQQSSYGANRTR